MSTVKQFSLARGEIPPSLYARTDQTAYSVGLKTCRNMAVMRQGGAANRAGTRFVGEVKSSNRLVRVIDFIFNEGQAYALEFGHLSIRVIFEGAYITETAMNITGITQASPGVFSVIAHGYSAGDEIYISGVVGMTEVNNRNWRVLSVLTPNTFTLEYLDGTALDTTGFGAYVSGGTAERVFTIVSPYDENDLFRLTYFQSADVMTILHNSYAPRELRRTSHTSWTLQLQTRAPSISAPTGLNCAATGTFNAYVVTAIDAETSEESLQSNIETCGGQAPAPSPLALTLTWNAVSGAGKYAVYRRVNGIFFFLNFAGSETFTDDGITPDFSRTPPTARDPFNGSSNWPATGCYSQSRLLMGNLPSNSEIIHASRIGNFKNFSKSDPIQSDSTVSFQLPGRTVNEVRHMVDLKRLVVLTSNGEWSCGGNTAHIILPGEVNPTQHGYNGSSFLRPIIIAETIIYVQAQGSKIRDLFFSFTDDVGGYTGNDITVWGAHLVDNYTLVDWCYEQEPHSIIWAVRNDGILIGITYIREQKMIAFHRHDLKGGLVESVCAVPEGGRTAVYMVVKREIDGRTVRYVERLNDRFVADVEDCILLDSSLTYDGWNADDTQTMKITNGIVYDHTEYLTLVSNFVFFEATDIGREIHLRDDDGNVVRFEIEEFVLSTQVKGHVQGPIPAALQDTFTTEWAEAISTLTNLHHIEGEDIGVFADSFVVASPNNNQMPVITVTDGEAVLDRPYAKVHAGLPILADIYTLDIDTVQGETLMNKEKLVNRVGVSLVNSRGLWAGPRPPEDDDVDPQQNLVELKIRENETMLEPVSLHSGDVEIDIYADWNPGGSVFLRQIDPVPIQISSIAPTGLIPFRRFGS